MRGAPSHFAFAVFAVQLMLPAALSSPKSIQREEVYSNETGASELHSRPKRKMSPFHTYQIKNRLVPYHIGGTLHMKNEWMMNVATGINEWTSKTCLRFVRYSSVQHNMKGFLKITNIKGGCFCGSYVNLGGPYPNVACKDVGTVIHELGHWIGMSHEQKRPDSRAFLRFNRWNIGDDDWSQFVRDTIMYSRTSVPYDLHSIMQYYQYSFAKDYKHTTIDANDDRLNYAVSASSRATFYDIKLANLVYNCSDSCGVRRYTKCDNEGYMDKYCRCVCPDFLTPVSNCKALNVTGCGGILNLNPGHPVTVKSPNYPGSYTNRKTCVWLIRSPQLTTVHARFADFDLEDDPKTKHCEDQLEVRHVGLAHPGIRLCGNRRPPDITSEYNNMMLIFKTDPAVVKRGFHVHLHALRRKDCDSTPCYNGGVCRMSQLIYFCVCPSGYSGRNCERKYDGKLSFTKSTDSGAPRCPSGLREMPLGMKSGKIPDKEIKASSSLPNCPPHHARLDRLSPAVGGHPPCHAWCPAGYVQGDASFKHWIMVDLQEQTRITSVVIQPPGGFMPNRQEVWEFRLLFGDNGRQWKPYGGEDHSFKTTITGDGNSFWVRTRITPVTARFIMLKVIGQPERISRYRESSLYPCMRFEVYGCAKPGTTEPPLPTLPTLPPPPTTPKPTEHLVTGCALQYMTLTCPSGQTIRIKAIGWGRPHLISLRTKCNLDTQQCPFQTISDSRMETLRERCDNKRTCRIHAYYTELGDPCPHMAKMALVSHLCLGTPTDEEAACRGSDGSFTVACLSRLWLEAGCSLNGLAGPEKNAKQVEFWRKNTLAAVKADMLLYKQLADTRQENPHGQKYTDLCFGGTVTNAPNPQPTVVPRPTNPPRPQPTVTPPEEKRLVICTAKHGELSCPSGQTIQLSMVAWGRPTAPSTLRAQCGLDSRSCPFWAVTGAKKQVLQNRCDGKRSCRIHAYYTELGDPCPGLGKLAWVIYNCRTSVQIPSAGCKDEHDSVQCAAWAKLEECKKNPSWMLKNCKLSCGECLSLDQASPTRCTDMNQHCADWAKNGECQKNPAYMLVHCRRSCGECGSCIDHSDNCPGWAKIGECEKNAEYMDVHCQRSCGMCPGKMSAMDDPLFSDEQCSDDNQHCPAWVEKGECTRNPLYMHVQCSNSCRTCNCTDSNKDCSARARRGECATNHWMHVHCRRSCRLCCPSGDEGCCIDHDARCAKWAVDSKGCQEGEDQRDLWQDCPHSCGKCS